MAKGKKTKKDKGAGDGTHLIASYTRAYRDYDILDTYEAGVGLTGSAVKSLREGNAQIAEFRLAELPCLETTWGAL